MSNDHINSKLLYTQGNFIVLESLLHSYQTLQQTFTLHMSSATNETRGDAKIESIRRAFIDINEKANMSMS